MVSLAILPVPNPRTYTAGEFVTAGELNAIRDAINFLANVPMAILYQTTAQSVLNGTFSAVALDTTTVDTYSGHSNATNNTRYTAQVPGTYGLPGQAAFSANGTGVRAATFYKNGSQIEGATIAVAQAVTTSGSNSIVTCWAEVFLNVGDYVELMAYQTSGVGLNTASGGAGQRSGMSPFWMHA